MSVPGRHAIAFGGVTVRQVAIRDFTLAEAVYPAHRAVPVHTHADPHVGMVIEGSCRERSGSRSADLRPPDVVVKAPGDRHSNQAGPRGTRYLLLDVANAARTHAVFDAYHELRTGILAALTVHLRRELVLGDGASLLSLEGLILELLAEISRTKAERPERFDPPWLGTACEALHARAGEPLDLGSLAAEVGVHPAHLARTFRRRLGLTPGQYLRRVRLERAIALLARTDCAIAEVAVASGFYDQSHLTNLMQRTTGLTPSQYRRAARA
jgi:AraC family transcriptional regulator